MREGNIIHRTTISFASQIHVIFIHYLLQVPNNYETDLIFPIIEKASKLANVSYDISDDQTKRYLKVSMTIFKQASIEFQCLSITSNVCYFLSSFLLFNLS